MEGSRRRKKIIMSWWKEREWERKRDLFFNIKSLSIRISINLRVSVTITNWWSWLSYERTIYSIIYKQYVKQANWAWMWWGRPNHIEKPKLICFNVRSTSLHFHNSHFTASVYTIKLLFQLLRGFFLLMEQIAHNEIQFSSFYNFKLKSSS